MSATNLREQLGKASRASTGDRRVTLVGRLDGVPLAAAVNTPTIEAMIGRPPWMRDALCREYPAVTFFPEQGESSADAKAICRRCVVRSECLLHALDTPSMEGIWGGAGRRSRDRLRKSNKPSPEGGL
jgi:WhiB family redox-sensing transcriptional regulator